MAERRSIEPVRELSRAAPIRDLNLSIEGSPLEPVLAEFGGELERVGIRKVRPRFYLSTEWGVNEGTVAVAIPFYLARPDLTELHAERVGHVEGVGRVDLLRYLRHEMGHVVNYAYRLFLSTEWTDLFGPMDLPYVEEYQPVPFSRRFVRHLPGWYAQKHPDEDWAETFAVWMTPGFSWRTEYADWPEALKKLQYCERIMAALADREPDVTADDLDGDVSELSVSIDEFYSPTGTDPGPAPSGLDESLRTVFEGLGDPSGRSVAALIRSIELALCASVFHWTGIFPERTRPLLRTMADRAEALGLRYDPSREAAAAAVFSTFVAVMAISHAREEVNPRG